MKQSTHPDRRSKRSFPADRLIIQSLLGDLRTPVVVRGGNAESQGADVDVTMVRPAMVRQFVGSIVVNNTNGGTYPVFDLPYFSPRPYSNHPTAQEMKAKYDGTGR